MQSAARSRSLLRCDGRRVGVSVGLNSSIVNNRLIAALPSRFALLTKSHRVGPRRMRISRFHRIARTISLAHSRVISLSRRSDEGPSSSLGKIASCRTNTFDKHLCTRRGITRGPIAHKDVSHARVFSFSLSLLSLSRFFVLRFRNAIHRAAVCVSVRAILPRGAAIEPASFILPPSSRQVSRASESLTPVKSDADGGRSKFISNPPCGKRPSVESSLHAPHSLDRLFTLP